MPNDIKILEKLTKEWEPRIRRAFLEAIQDVLLSINMRDLESFIDAGDVEAIIRMIDIGPDDFLRVQAALTDTFAAGGAAITSTIVSGPISGMRIGFDVRNFRAEQWLTQRSSGLITELVEEQRGVIRTYLREGMAAGRNPRSVALDLVGRINKATGRRLGGVIGLTSGQEGWARNYVEEIGSTNPTELRKALARGLRNKRYDRSILKAIREGRGLPLKMQQQMALSYRNRALLYRATNIARTEALEALSEAQHQAYQQAIDKGAVEAGMVKRFWHTAGDERVRSSHAAIPGMNKSGRGMNEPFRTPDGLVMKPPAGINCRCHVRMSINFAAMAAKAEGK